MSDPRPAGIIDPADVGSVFVSNYPPYGAWRADQVEEAMAALDTPCTGDAPPLGLYLHIPFCRVRCRFCYFKVYTEKDSSQVRSYLAGLTTELQLLARRPAVAGRPLHFLYFGGGTPSYISVKDLRSLVATIRSLFACDRLEESTFECEPGTLTQPKVDAIRAAGLTRLSLGVETFDDEVLKENGRAHLSAEIYRCLPWIRAAGFEQLNIDLIAGMVGETWETWKENVRRTIEIAPESVTIYQMELPHNTRYSQDALEGRLAGRTAGWADKRAWHAYAFEQLEASGYEMSSAYTMVRRGRGATFVYRDAVWHGCDMLGTGVASFSHVGGVHFQNDPEWDGYLRGLEEGRLPLSRALRMTPAERMTREAILQLKLGRLEGEYFRRKFGEEITARFGQVFERLETQGMLRRTAEGVELTREGLLRVDHLLPELYAPQYRDTRYT